MSFLFGKKGRIEFGIVHFAVLVVVVLFLFVVSSFRFLSRLLLETKLWHRPRFSPLLGTLLIDCKLKATNTLCTTASLG
jgi:hypothetical protein